VSGDGKSLVSVQTTYTANIYVREAGDDTERKLTSDVGKDNGLSGVAWAPDGRIVYTARTVGNQDLWIVNADGTGTHQITSDSGKNFHPTVAPDGSRIAFVSSRAGNIDLWSVNVDGSDPVQLTETPTGIEGRPQYTPDGKWIVYDLTEDNERSSVWKVPAGGGEPVKLTNGDAWRPTISVDGRSFACRYKAKAEDKDWKIAVFLLEGTAAPRVFDLPELARSNLFRWNSTGDKLIFMESVLPGSGSELHVQALNSRKDDILSAKSPESSIYYFDVSRNGRGIALARGSQLSEAVVITNFR
jgi:TolB protein